MKVPINLTIDHEKKVLFDSLKSVHGKTFSSILNEGVEACLSEIKPSKLLEEEISRTQGILAELEENLVKVRMIEEQAKIQKKAAEQKEDPADKYLEEMRYQKFEEYKDNTIKLWKKGDMNWPRIVDLYQFRNAAEAKEWFRRKMAEVC